MAAIAAIIRSRRISWLIIPGFQEVIFLLFIISSIIKVAFELYAALFR